jgi:hypothetical protein
MYYPYFRGKQYELVTIRENAQRMGTKIIPIIEPVKLASSGLKRAIEKLIDENVCFILIVNPRCGDFCYSGSSVINREIRPLLNRYKNWSLGCIVDQSSTDQEIIEVTGQNSDVSIIHYGYVNGADLADKLRIIKGIRRHIFIDNTCSRLYRRHFKGEQRILIRDGFVQRTNRDHPPMEHFSDLHITFQDEGVDGFGDFLIVGDEYSDTGGPAYAVAIHITFIDRNQDDDMFIKHYVSERSATPTDPAGKFAEAVSKLVADVNRRKSSIFRSEAIDQFFDLHNRGHYPGLGFIKKLSMQHHIELIADFIR